ncbi:MAG: extracellular solute-binding protein [Lachnoclostridium sp.]|nr:extracellular solute-binding protein [Lachnospira sp.]MCM1246888.1 extracellular solute-binding protein [Lachnoclostridium sp.]
MKGAIMVSIIKRIRKKGIFTKAAALISAFAISFLFAGCSGADGQTGNQNSSAVLSQESGQGKNETGMGRYVEKNVFELGEEGRYEKTHLQTLSDGRVEIYNDILGAYLSEDNGDSWKGGEKDLYGDYLNPEKNYIIASAVSKEGVIALCYSPYETEGLVPNSCVLLFPDGTEKSFDLKLSEEEMYVRSFAFDESGKLYAGVFGDTIYEVDVETGNVKEFVDIAGSKYYLQCKNNILLCATYDKLYLYDRENEAFIEDDVLQDFIKENYGGIEYNNSCYSARVFFGEENVLYVAGEKGIHRHVIGGSAMEQMVDGKLSSLGDPSHGVVDAIIMENQEFLVQYSDLKTVKFSYDATVSTVPNNSLTVYSLRENDTVRQAVSAYQTANPDVYVNYEVGIEEGITREDALKALNTKILEGSGPDVLILDDMPVDSYINKGVLMDLADVLQEMEGEEEFFRNLLEPFYQGESLYEIPAEFMLPVICGDKALIAEADDYEGIADAMEALRKEMPDEYIFSVYSEKGVMRKFAMICAPSWTNERGEVNQEKLKEFLYQSKRIYDAAQEGIAEEVIDMYAMRDSEEIEKGIPYVDSIYFQTFNAMGYVMGSERLLCGAVSGMDDYSNLISLPKTEGVEGIDFKVMNGQSKNVYMPMTLAGINASVEDKEMAVAFLKLLLSEETQNLTHYGYPINSRAFENKFVVNPGWVAEDGSYMYYTMEDAEGKVIEWQAYLPDEGEMQKLRDYIAQADTPYLSDSVLEEAVYTEGAAYLRGDKDLDAAVKGIVDKVEIYLSE